MAYYQFNLHSYWLPGDCYYGEIKDNPNVLSSAGILLVLITDLLPRPTYSHYLMGKQTVLCLYQVQHTVISTAAVSEGLYALVKIA